MITIRYWAAAKEAAGVAEEQVRGGTLADVLAEVTARHSDSPTFERVLRICALLVDGTPSGSRDPATVPVNDGATVEVLPPYAGG
ncbi:MAG TPA: MoaD/ThiS family protein [Actinopolymorphaceae bacterium]